MRALGLLAAAVSAAACSDSVSVVMFRSAPVSPSASTVAVDRTTAPADGVTSAVVTVTVLDTFRRPMKGQSVQITFSGSGSVSPTSMTTGPLGTASFSVTASAPTTGTVTATVNPGSSPVTLSMAPVLSFATFYRIGGSISGLSGPGLVLTTPGQPQLAVSASAASFTFAQAVESGATYAVTVVSQPSNQTCWVVNGRGAGPAHRPAPRRWRAAWRPRLRPSRRAPAR